ncbi:MAG: YggT family protein [Candidatus Gracilibacteria bacterium]|nr:YggT family protein [Candidatus Gracilibacteria bacterium]
MIIYATLIFLRIFEMVIFVDIILSWTRPFGEKFRYYYIAPLLEPIYNLVRKFIPTRLGIFDFTPIIVLLLIWFIAGIIITHNPGITTTISF